MFIYDRIGAVKKLATTLEVGTIMLGLQWCALLAFPTVNIFHNFYDYLNCDNVDFVTWDLKNPNVFFTKWIYVQILILMYFILKACLDCKKNEALSPSIKTKKHQ